MDIDSITSLGKTSAERVYEQIKDRIEMGEYAPSQRLIENELVKSLEVSRHNIRVAFERLQADGLVKLEPNRGARVASLNLEEALDILVAREALEVKVTRLAAKSISAAELSELQAILINMQESLDKLDFSLYSAANKAFHQIIYQASQNKTMPELLGHLRQRLARLQLRTILIPGRSEASMAEHQAIYEALAKHDEVAAETAIGVHLQHLRGVISHAWHLIKN
ncbi:MAG: GntR family transcriptional regulator [Deinococcales bacterium]